jgi:hypothetical protein
MLSQSSLTSASTTGASRVREQAQHLIEFCVIQQRIMIVTKQSMKRSTKTARQHNFHSLLTHSRNKGVRPMLLELWSGYSTQTEPKLAFACSMNERRMLSLHSKHPIKHCMAWYYSIIAMQCPVTLLLNVVSLDIQGQRSLDKEDDAGTATHGHRGTVMRLDIDMWFETDQIRSMLWDLELRIGPRRAWKLDFVSGWKRRNTRLITSVFWKSEGWGLGFSPSQNPMSDCFM